MTLGEPFAAPMSSLSQPLGGPVRWHQLRLTAAVLCFASAVLTIVSTFLPLYTSELNSSGMSYSMTVTAWHLDVTGGVEFGDSPVIGYPLIFAGIALICAATTGAFAAVPTATPGGHRVAGLTTATATAFLAGTAWTVVMQVTSWVDSSDGSDAPLSLDLSAGYGAGFWLLLVAVMVAVVAVVLALLPPSQRRRTPAEPDLSTANLPTPPYGFAVVVELPREPSPYAPPPVDYHAQPAPADLATAPPAAPPPTAPAGGPPAVPAPPTASAAGPPAPPAASAGGPPAVPVPPTASAVGPPALPATPAEGPPAPPAALAEAAPSPAIPAEAGGPPVPVAEPPTVIQPVAPAVAPSPAAESTAEPAVAGNPVSAPPGAETPPPAGDHAPAVPAVEDPLAPPLDEQTIQPR